MKYLILLFFAVTSTAISAQSQSSSFDKELNTMAKTYELTDHQKASVKDILIEKSERLKDLKKGSELTRVEYMDGVQRIQQEYDSKLVLLLDDKQKKIFQSQKVAQSNYVQPVKIENR